MARFHGIIGYGVPVENPTGSGIWTDEITEYPYYGDVIRNTRRSESSDKINDDILVSNSISIVADQYANEHIFAMRYIRWAGSLWEISSAEVQRPRIILQLGKLYNGPVPLTP